MEWESDSPCCSHTYAGQEYRSPGRGSSWELEFRDCGAVSVQWLLWTVERWIEEMWGRRLWWETPVEESQAAMEARWYCWVTRRWWSHHHSLSLHTPASAAEQWRDWPIKHLTHWTTEQGPTQGALSSAGCADLQSRTPPGVPLPVPDALIYRVGPHPGCPFQCPMCQSTE